MGTFFGYRSEDCCVVCGGYDDNRHHPLHNYTVCRHHQRVRPIDIEHLWKKSDD